MTNNNITMSVVVLRPQDNGYCVITTIFTTTVTSTLYRLRLELKCDSFSPLNSGSSYRSVQLA